MTDNIKNTNHPVDDAGIRLAPPPIHTSNYHVMPSVMQEFVIEPHLEIEKEWDHDSHASESTARDLQPKQKDVNKRWKRAKRGRNLVVGTIMFVLTVAVLLPYVLSACAVQIKNMPFAYIPAQYNVVDNLVQAIKTSIHNGWKGDIVNQAWVHAVPSMILAIGIFSLVINMIKSLFGMLISFKPISYTPAAVVYLLSVLAVFVAALVGAEEIGIAKINFVNDFIKGYATSELFSLVVLSAGYAICSLICTLVGSDNRGYLR